MDGLAAAIAVAWNVAVLIVLWRVRARGALFVVLAFALVSLYPADRVLPRVLVDAWPNFDAVGSPALRPWFVLPDVLLIASLFMRGTFPPSRPAWLILAALGVATAAGLAMSAGRAAIPFESALFWATIPIRGMLVIMLVDATIRRDGSQDAANQVVSAAVAGAGVLAIELLAVTALQGMADLIGYDLASIWSGFNWVRPNLPGWNNNLAASAIALGGSAAILLPEHTRWPWSIRIATVAVSALALLAAEYRTAIIVLVAASAMRAGAVVFARMRPRMGRAALAPAVGTAAITVVVLLASAAVAVPRLADLNPIAYVTQGLGRAAGPPPPGEVLEIPGDEADTSSLSRALILQAALSVWLREPVTGPGLGSWEFDRPTVPTFLQKAITPHNGYAWALADLGLLGLASFYLIPGVMVLWRGPPLALLAWVVLLAVLEVSTVGIAHARLAMLYWAALGVVALSTWREATRERPIVT